jgi:hypothetical protein
MANVIARQWGAGKMMLLRYRKTADIFAYAE